MTTVIIILFCIYSWFAHCYMIQYWRECKSAEVEPFGNNTFKYILASIACGGISIIILILATIAVFRDWIKKKLF